MLWLKNFNLNCKLNKKSVMKSNQRLWNLKEKQREKLRIQEMINPFLRDKLKNGKKKKLKKINNCKNYVWTI